MSFARTAKVVIPIEAVTTTASTALTGNIDTKGYDYLIVNCIQGTQSATTKPTTLKLSECDTTVVNQFTDVPGCLGGTDFTIPESYTSTTSGQWVAQFNVDLRGRKRYIKVAHYPGTVTYVTCCAMLFRGETAPDSAATANAAVRIAV